MLTVTRKFKFCYGHFLPDYEGKCKNVHGHNATLEVELGGYVIHPGGKATYGGMIIDFGDLKKVVEKEVIDLLDHKLINDIQGIEDCRPTAENMTMWIVGRLYQSFGKNLRRIRLYETDDCYAEWRADET